MFYHLKQSICPVLIILGHPGMHQPLSQLALYGNSMVGAQFYSALYGITYRLPNVTYIVAVGIYSAEGVVKRGTNKPYIKHTLTRNHFSPKCLCVLYLTL